MYPQIVEQNQINEFNSLLEQSDSILIVTHKGPDDDAIGSTLSTYNALSATYPKKNIQMRVSNPPLDRWAYFKSYNQIQFIKDVSENLDTFDLIIFLDGSLYERFTSSPQNFESYHGNTIVIDHHIAPPDKFTLPIIYPSVTSATEIVYFLLYQNQTTISQQDAETLLLGILGDTGNLLYVSSEKSYIYLIVERLVREGKIKVDLLHSKYSKYSERVFMVLKEYMNNFQVVELPNWPKFTTSYISKALFTDRNFSYQEIKDATELFVDQYLRAITGASWGVAVYPKEDEFGVSLRSTSEGVNVRKIVEGMNVGGGHNLAAGGKFKITDPSLDSADYLSKVVDYLKLNHPNNDTLDK